jgi:single-strand DNA-binding protein
VVSFARNEVVTLRRIATSLTQHIKDTFKKRDFVVEIQDGNHPQHIKIQVIQDRCNLLENYKPGQQVKVLFNLWGMPFRNREDPTVYFTYIEACRIEGIGSGAPQGKDYSQAQEASSKVDEFDDVPFWLGFR